MMSMNLMGLFLIFTLDYASINLKSLIPEFYIHPIIHLQKYHDSYISYFKNNLISATYHIVLLLVK